MRPSHRSDSLSQVHLSRDKVTCQPLSFGTRFKSLPLENCTFQFHSLLLLFFMQCVCVRVHASASLKGHGSTSAVLVRVRQVPGEKVLVRILTRAIREAPVTLLGSVFAMRVRVRVHVRGRLHSLNSTVIDMGVRHCPVNEITSLIQSVHQKKAPPSPVHMDCMLSINYTACLRTGSGFRS